LNISKATGVKEEEELWYEHVPKSGETSHDATVTILWIQQVTTDRTIPNRKTDIIHHNEKRHVCYHKLQLQETELCSRKKMQIFKTA